MGFGSLDYTKLDYAQTLAATLAYYLSNQRDSVGLMTFDETIGDFLSARNRPGHLRSMLVALSRPVTGKGTDLDGPLRQIAALVKRRGLIVLISDLLTPIETLQQNLAYLRSRGHEVMILRVLDPGELELSLSSVGMVVDMESGKEIYLDPDAARNGYREKFENHRQRLQTIGSSLGVEIFEMMTDQPIEQALFDVISVQKRRSSGSNRAGMLSAGSGVSAGMP